MTCDNAIPGLKIFRGNANSIVRLPKTPVIAGDLEIHCGSYSTIDIRSLSVKGHGHKVSVGDRSLVRAATIGINGTGCTLQIGAGFKCGSARFIIQKKSITIGDGVLFSQNIVVRTSDMHSIIDLESDEVLNPPKEVIIGDRVWVGQDCHIVKGAVIGNDTVIGAHSMVRGEIPPNVVAAGIPAAVVRRGIRWSSAAP